MLISSLEIIQISSVLCMDNSRKAEVFACIHCNKNFNLKDSCTQHKKYCKKNTLRIHFECDLCPKVYSTHSNLIRHTRTIHSSKTKEEKGADFQKEQSSPKILENEFLDEPTLPLSYLDEKFPEFQKQYPGLLDEKTFQSFFK